MVSFALMITQATILLCKSGEPRLTDEKNKKGRYKHLRTWLSAGCSYRPNSHSVQAHVLSALG